MKTQEEIEIEKSRLKKLRDILPEFSKFSDANHVIIDAQLDVLDGNITDEDQAWDREDELGEGVLDVIDALNWMEGDYEGSLVNDNDLIPKKPKKDVIDAFRTRWKRWLGQKCRLDKENWTTLLDRNWMSWVYVILLEHSLDYVSLKPPYDRESVYKLYLSAIEIATMEDMGILDHMYCEDLLEKQEKRKK